MKTSVLIIAHNEERYIAKCIESVLHQTEAPDEVVLVVHNSTDRTLEIAERFPITIVPFNGPKGIVAARLEGLNHVSGDIIVCIDGDSYASENWVAVMAATLQHNRNVLVGSWVKFKGTIFGALYTLYSRYAGMSKGRDASYWIWGPSHAFWGKDKSLVKEVLKSSAVLSSAIQLPRNPEDYWLALFMGTHGNLERTNQAWVAQYTKEASMSTMISRRTESSKNKESMDRHFEKIKSQSPMTGTFSV